MYFLTKISSLLMSLFELFWFVIKCKLIILKLGIFLLKLMKLKSSFKVLCENTEVNPLRDKVAVIPIIMSLVW